ncbi:MAG: hypothetical protein JNK30_08105 [Phenylobacterium sp.]|uniref:hypothetical protein n=1 Tax=Phenylobacterium sp. TaxID=1871053 RepID=UPI001A51D4B1|nr:hypothetical protein [Phenylobacterium sp.]MBL8771333.1 hypothetical protein [Phenylobacterium sp.]
MNARVDISSFPVGQNIDYQGAEAVAALEALTTEARAFVDSYRWAPPVEDLVLAFGVGPIIGLYLMRFEPGGKQEDRERWVVVGDLPRMHFETDEAPTPALALTRYCAIAGYWADNVLAGADLSDSYPIEAAPTPEHAEMLNGRIDFILRELVPLAV